MAAFGPESNCVRPISPEGHDKALGSHCATFICSALLELRLQGKDLRKSHHSNPGLSGGVTSSTK